MRNSFVAVISRFGLESLLPECNGAHRWLCQVANERPATCLWAVMERERAIAIHELLLAGECDWALGELARAADFMGSLPAVSTWVRREAAS